MPIPSVGGETSTSLATQNADAVAITGGAISGCTIANKSTRSGTFICNGATPVTVSNTTFAITDVVCVSLNVVGGTVGAIPAVKTVTAGSGFTIAGTASDTSTYTYTLLATV